MTTKDTSIKKSQILRSAEQQLWREIKARAALEGKKSMTELVETVMRSYLKTKLKS